MQKYNDVIQDEFGNVITTATVTVFDAGTGSPSDIFEDDESTPLNNPFTVSDSNYASNGSFWFKAANGNYDIQVVIGSNTELKEDETLFDASENGALLNNTSGTTAPTVNDDADDGYEAGSYWIDIVASPKESYRCLDATVGAAIWLNTTLEVGDLGALAVLNIATIATGGTGQTTAQAAINALSQVSGATNEHVLTKDTATGDVKFKAVSASVPADSVGQDEIDTAELAPIVQIARTDDSAVATGTNNIPRDDTIPQITEGDEYMTVVITPTSAANKLIIESNAVISNAAATTITLALFQDSIANALAANTHRIDTGGQSYHASVNHEMVAGTTSPITFRIRAGGISNTTTFNGASGARIYGGVANSYIKVTEVLL